MFRFGGLGALFGGLSPLGDGTACSYNHQTDHHMLKVSGQNACYATHTNCLNAYNQPTYSFYGTTINASRSWFSRG